MSGWPGRGRGPVGQSEFLCPSVGRRCFPDEGHSECNLWRISSHCTTDQAYVQPDQSNINKKTLKDNVCSRSLVLHISLNKCLLIRNLYFKLCLNTHCSFSVSQSVRLLSTNNNKDNICRIQRRPERKRRPAIERHLEFLITEFMATLYVQFLFK